MTKPKIINAGPDTFIVNYKFAGEDDKPNGETLPEHVTTQLEEWQTLARKDHNVVATDLLFSYRVGEKEYKQSLLMRPHGSGIWLLYCDDVKLSLSYGTMNNGLFCQARFSSHLLWSIGPESALIALEAMLYDLLGSMVYQQASEIHLCVDVQEWDMTTLDWQHAFVSRVVRIRERPEVPTEEEQAGGMSPNERRKLEESIHNQIHDAPCYAFPTTVHRKLATLDFGSHGSNISCQIYNKSAEIKVHKKDWFEPIWAANGYNPDLTVWRIEFRFKRKFLASFNLNEAFSVLGQLDKLWTYATTEWLRYVDLSKSSDTNKSRLPTHEAWEVIQQAYSVESDTAATRDAQGERSARLARLLDEKPLQVLEQAASSTLVLSQTENENVLSDADLAALTVYHDARSFPRLALSVAFLHHVMEKQQQTTMMDNLFAVRETFQREEKDVVQQAAHEAVATLGPDEIERLVLHLSPEPFHEVQAGLIKRSRTMAKRKACIAGAIGYMRSAVALAGDEVGGVRPGASPEEHQASLPDLMTSLIWFFGQVQKYDDKKGRVHIEEVLKKRLAYNFITAQELEHQRAHYGVDLHQADWAELADMIDQLRMKPSDVWLKPNGSSDVA